jgi:hypothetical protein
VRINSSGNVGIGTTSPSEKLQVYGTAASGSTQGPRINIQYSGTSGAAESLVNFLDFRGVVNAAIGNSLWDDGVGSAAAEMVFKTANSGTLTERMRISRAGYVTKPYHPAFATRGLGNAQVNSYANDLPSSLLFNSTSINTGSFYNSSTGRFTAPVTGVYYFSWSLLVDNNAATGTVSYAQLYKNGASTGFTCYTMTPVGGYYTPMSQSCVVSLNANDYVNVQGLGGNIHTGSESAFTGFLIG